MADLISLRAVRRRKERALRRAGIDPYPEKIPPREPIGDIAERFSALMRSKKAFGIAGRVMALREHGGVTFLDCRDESGRIQVFFSQEMLGEKAYRLVKLLDLGDIVSVRGSAMKTRRGEKTILAESFTFLAKALRPLPDEWYGLKDIEERFRNREVDLLLNDEVKERFLIRSTVLRELRGALEEQGFLEVETPILQPIAGGAAAEPFRTTLRALKLPLYLRIAPELYLKRLLVGGFEKVFELGRLFRNEGIDQTHNPEFTSLEFYWAYQDLEGLMRFTEKLLQRTVRSAVGSLTLHRGDRKVSFKAPFAKHEFAKQFTARVGVHPVDANQRELIRAAKKHSVPTKNLPRSVIVDHLFKRVVVPSIQNATFILHHPVDLSPLAKTWEADERYAQRFQVIAGGLEIVNAYAELNDPQEQRRRFKAEKTKRRSGDRETHPYDEDFLTALEYGMPPAAGFGLGVDRLTMLLTDAPSLREVIFFPTMRPKRS